MTLNHHRAGSGEPLLLIHGIGSHWRVWEPVLPLLEAEREVIAVDLPGFGESAPLPAGTPPTIAALAESLVRLLDDVGWERPHVAGNSLGGWLALELVRRGRSSRNVPLSPGGFYSRRERSYAVVLLDNLHRSARAIAPYADRLCATAAGRVAAFATVCARPARLDPAGAAAALRNLAASPGFQPTLATLRDDHFRGGGELSGEIVIGWGAKDRLLLPRQGDRAARAIRAARLVALPGCGHVPMSDDPQLVADLILGR